MTRSKKPHEIGKLLALSKQEAVEEGLPEPHYEYRNHSPTQLPPVPEHQKL